MSFSKNQEGRTAPNEIADLASRFSRVTVSIANIEASAPELLQRQYAVASQNEAPTMHRAPVAPVVEVVPPVQVAQQQEQIVMTTSYPNQSSAPVYPVNVPAMSAHEAMARRSVDDAYEEAA